MSTSRRGIPLKDMRLEARVRKIEQALDGSSITPRAGDVDVEEDGVPKVSGVSLDPGLRGIAIRWNDPGIPQAQLDFFEVQFATNAGFSTGVVTFSTKDLQYTYSGGDPNTTYFARVRAVLNSGDPGEYSTTLNTATGQAVTEDITENAVTTPASSFTSTQQTIGPSTQAEVQSTIITKDGSDIYVFGSVVLKFSAATAIIGVDMFLYRDGTELASISFTAATTEQAFSYSIPDTSGVTGAAEYTIELLNGSTTVNLLVTERSLALVEIKR